MTEISYLLAHSWEWTGMLRNWEPGLIRVCSWVAVSQVVSHQLLSCRVHVSRELELKVWLRRNSGTPVWHVSIWSGLLAIILNSQPWFLGFDPTNKAVLNIRVDFIAAFIVIQFVSSVAFVCCSCLTHFWVLTFFCSVSDFLHRQHHVPPLPTP